MTTDIEPTPIEHLDYDSTMTPDEALRLCQSCGPEGLEMAKRIINHNIDMGEFGWTAEFVSLLDTL